MAKLLKWETELLEWLKNATNEEVFEQCLSDAIESSDEFSTSRISMEYGYSRSELIDRLKKAKFLSEDYE